MLSLNCYISFFVLGLWASLLVSVSRVNAVPLVQAPEEDNSVYDKIEVINKKLSKKRLFEGDIVETWIEEQVVNGKSATTATKREAKKYSAALWVTRVVPYEISSDFASIDETNAIRSAMNIFEQKTCLTFVQRTTEKHWISIEKLDGCYSAVGRVYWVEGAQTLSLGRGCLGRSTILHEIMHALGFWHEQSRPDRDSYVEIFWENIDPDNEHNFEKYSHLDADVLNVGYDYQSLMHYGKKAFTKNGEITMQAIGNANLDLGQNSDLDSSDLTQLNALYDCASKDISVWSSWSTYSPCNTYCNKIRHRFCSNENRTQCPTADTNGIETDRLKCSDAECYVPLDGHWGRWSSWESCDQDCGPGKQNRTRTCDNPAPKYGGKDCVGDSTSNKDCLIKTCGIGPYDCEFDGAGWCAWKVDPANAAAYTWSRISGKTPSGGTGPLVGDHTTGSGSYLYAESSAPAQTGNKARIISQEMKPTQGLCLKFWYHMQGRTMGSLRVFIRSSSGAEKEIWMASGSQSEQWLTSNKTIVSDTTFTVIFESQKGGGYLSDICLDDILFKDGSCEKSAIETMCGVRMRSHGCFADAYANRLLPNLVSSYRMPGQHFIDWNNYEESLQRVMCDCAKKVKNAGDKIFGLQYYGECWSGTGNVNYTTFGPSTNCVDGKFEECSSAKDSACIGAEETNYIYELL